ncbi:MAG: peptide MFS transporter, partial [Longimicrobiales bacterium]
RLNMNNASAATNLPEPPSTISTDTSFFGHPRGLATLFFTEMWERWGYYGMRALLILFMTATVADGGLGFDVAKAGAIYAMYTSLVYFANLPGGWVADRILGQRKSVLYGGIVITLGHFTMAIPGMATFYLGLVLIIFGTGMLKPNISVMVGQMYSETDIRRDSGFSIFYMGINLGAFIAPLVTGYLGEKVDWHMGFAAAGVGMALGVLQYLIGGKYLGNAGRVSASAEEQSESKALLFKVLGGLIVAIGAVTALAMTGVIQVSEEGISNAYGIMLLVTVAGFFTWLFTRPYWSADERKRLYVIAVLFVAAAVFWSFFEQAGSSLNLFADDFTNRTLPGWFPFVNGEFPASWFQSVNALFIIALAPLFAWLWVYLAKRKKEPSSPGKFVFGLLFVGLGFVVMAFAAMMSQAGAKVSPNWLILTYLLHTIGELSLSPVGLSAMTKLAPTRVVSLMMGVWFLAASVGNFMGGFLVRFYETLALPVLFGIMAAFAIAVSVVLALMVRPIRNMMVGTKH